MHNRYNAYGFTVRDGSPHCYDAISMIRKIVLSNFMAHAQTELRLSDGLTVLVGPNNIGKSTVAVALKILARNANSNFVMQHDQKECSISVETSEGHSIQWIKRKSPSYVINGQSKDRLGRGGTPPELDETLRLAAVEFEDKDFEPHFGDQKSPIFLINRPPSQIAQFFSTTSDAEKLVAMQRLHQRHRTEAQTKAKLLSAQNETIQQSIQSLESIPKLELELASLELESQSLLSLANEIEKLEALIRTYAALTVEQQFESHRAICLETLQPVPPFYSTELLSNVAIDWESTLLNVKFYGESSDQLASLTTAPKLNDEIPLSNMIVDLFRSNWNLQYLAELRSSQEGLCPPAPAIPTDDLQSLVEEITSLESECRRLDEMMQVANIATERPTATPEEPLFEWIQHLEKTAADFQRTDLLRSVLTSISPAPSMSDVTSLNDAILSFTMTRDQAIRSQETLVEVQEAIDTLESEAKRWIQTEPNCTTCGAKLTVDSVRFKMHRHGS